MLYTKEQTHGRFKSFKVTSDSWNFHTQNPLENFQLHNTTHAFTHSYIHCSISMYVHIIYGNIHCSIYSIVMYSGYNMHMSLTSCSSNLISSSCTYGNMMWSCDYSNGNHRNITFLSCSATRRQERVNSGHTCSIMSLGGSPLALLGLVLAGMASSGILPLIVCDYIISS